MPIVECKLKMSILSSNFGDIEVDVHLQKNY